MRARLVIVALSALAAGCVPDFVYGAGGGSAASGEGGSDTGGGRRGGDGGDGGTAPVAINSSGQAQSSAQSSAQSTSSSAGPTSTGSGEGGAGATSSTAQVASSSASTSTASTGSGGTEGVPCWDGIDDQVVTCTDGDVCCSEQYYSDHGCYGSGQCWRYELGCNEPSDCGGDRCCLIYDAFGDFWGTGCEASCEAAEACSPASGCGAGLACRPMFVASSHTEYDAYGACLPE